MSKHTLGPWNIENPWESDFSVIARVGGKIIAKTDNGVIDIGEAEANAHLIVAAPDLLEALKALQHQALQSELNSPAHEWGTEALGLARIAISKAEGRS